MGGGRSSLESRPGHRMQQRHRLHDTARPKSCSIGYINPSPEVSAPKETNSLCQFLAAPHLHRQVRSALAAGNPLGRRARAEVLLGAGGPGRASTVSVSPGGGCDRERGRRARGSREAVGMLEGAADELDEGLDAAVHDEQADVGRLVVHADPHELRHYGLCVVLTVGV